MINKLKRYLDFRRVRETKISSKLFRYQTIDTYDDVVGYFTKEYTNTIENYATGYQIVNIHDRIVYVEIRQLYGDAFSLRKEYKEFRFKNL